MLNSSKNTIYNGFYLNNITITNLLLIQARLSNVYIVSSIQLVQNIKIIHWKLLLWNLISYIYNLYYCCVKLLKSKVVRFVKKKSRYKICKYIQRRRLINISIVLWRILMRRKINVKRKRDLGYENEIWRLRCLIRRTSSSSCIFNFGTLNSRNVASKASSEMPITKPNLENRSKFILFVAGSANMLNILPPYLYLLVQELINEFLR